MKRMLIVSATGIVMIGALFVPLPRMERKETVTIPIQKSATIVLSQRITQPSIERKQESTTPERERKRWLLLHQSFQLKYWLNRQSYNHNHR